MQKRWRRLAHQVLDKLFRRSLVEYSYFLSDLLASTQQKVTHTLTGKIKLLPNNSSSKLWLDPTGLHDKSELYSVKVG